MTPKLYGQSIAAVALDVIVLLGVGIGLIKLGRYLGRSN